MAVNPEPDYYEILGVDSTATQEEIDKAFRKARRDNHPDKAGASAWAFRLVETAYETLKDADSRAAYDEAQRSGTAPSATSSAPSTPPPSSASTEPPAPSRAATTTAPTTATQQTAQPAPAPVQDTPTSYVVQPVDYEYEQTQLENFTFSPPANMYLWHILGALGASALGMFIMVMAWFTDLYKPALGLIAFVFTLIAVGLAAKKREIPRGDVISMVALVLGWAITGFPLTRIDSPLSQPIYLVGDVLYMLGGALAVLYMPKHLKVRDMNKRVPVKLLREARIYGSPSNPDMNIAAVLRNISDTIAPITAIKDGSFLIHLDGFKTEEFTYPITMTVIRGNQVALLSFMAGFPGQYGVTTDGNLVRIINGSLSHVENYNPQVLAAGEHLKKKLPNIEIKSIAIVIPTAMGAIEPYHSETTSVVPMEQVLPTLVEYFEAPVNIVRRDIINQFVPSISS